MFLSCARRQRDAPSSGGADRQPEVCIAMMEKTKHGAFTLKFFPFPGNQVLASGLLSPELAGTGFTMVLPVSRGVTLDAADQGLCTPSTGISKNTLRHKPSLEKPKRASRSPSSWLHTEGDIQVPLCIDGVGPSARGFSVLRQDLDLRCLPSLPPLPPLPHGQVFGLVLL